MVPLIQQRREKGRKIIMQISRKLRFHSCVGVPKLCNGGGEL